MNHKTKCEKGGYVFKKGCPNRKYRKQADRISQQREFLNFLIHNGYDLTAKMFQSQLQERVQEYNRIVDLITTVSNPNNKGYFSIQQFKNWIKGIKDHYQGTTESFVKLQFLLIVWFCTLGSKQEKDSRDNNLKKFIQTNGAKLSQFPELLPYFALPYIQEPKNHPYLRRIFSEQFILEIKGLLKQSLADPFKFKINPGFDMDMEKDRKSINLNEQIQWLVIVKDLIDISLHLNDKIELLNSRTNERDRLQKTQRHLEMIERVKQYQIVIENQKVFPQYQNHNQLSSQQGSMRPSQLSKLIEIPGKQFFVEMQMIKDKNEVKVLKQVLSIGSISNEQQEQSEYQQISYTQLKQSVVNLGLIKRSELQQFCLIFYALNARILGKRKLRKKIIREFIENDVLCLQKNDREVYPKKRFEMEYLKLLNSMCSFSLNQTCNYLLNTGFIEMMCSFIMGNKNYYIGKSQFPFQKNKENISDRDQSIGKQEKLCQVFGILQKVSTKRKIVEVILSTQIVPILIENFVASFTKLPSNLLTIVLGFLLNIILHKQGKQICSGQQFTGNIGKKRRERASSLFQLIIEIWVFISKKNSSIKTHDPLSYHSQLESLLYSIFYVLLSLQTNKIIAMEIKFKDSLEKFLAKNNDEYYSKVIGQIIKSLQSPSSEKLIQSSSEDQSQEELSEQDQSEDTIQKNLVWIGQQLSIIPYKDEKQDIQFCLKRYYKKNIKRDQKVATNQFYVNASAPIYDLNNEITRKKDQNLQQKNSQPTNNRIRNNASERYEKVAGYDPSKYQAWKKLKTSQ